MSRRTRAFVGLALLLLAAGHLVGAALHPVACEDGCPSACGDCASCPPLAYLAVLPAVTPALLRLAAIAPLSATSASRPARAIEHVPLAPRA